MSKGCEDFSVLQYVFCWKLYDKRSIVMQISKSLGEVDHYN
jgi:hypothetical protein